MWNDRGRCRWTRSASRCSPPPAGRRRARSRRCPPGTRSSRGAREDRGGRRGHGLARRRATRRRPSPASSGSVPRASSASDRQAVRVGILLAVGRPVAVRVPGPGASQAAARGVGRPSPSRCPRGRHGSRRRRVSASRGAVADRNSVMVHSPSSVGILALVGDRVAVGVNAAGMGPGAPAPGGSSDRRGRDSRVRREGRRHRCPCAAGSCQPGTRSGSRDRRGRDPRTPSPIPSRSESLRNGFVRDLVRSKRSGRPSLSESVGLAASAGTGTRHATTSSIAAPRTTRPPRPTRDRTAILGWMGAAIFSSDARRPRPCPGIWWMPGRVHHDP